MARLFRTEVTVKSVEEMILERISFAFEAVPTLLVVIHRKKDVILEEGGLKHMEAVMGEDFAADVKELRNAIDEKLKALSDELKKFLSEEKDREARNQMERAGYDDLFGRYDGWLKEIVNELFGPLSGSKWFDDKDEMTGEAYGDMTEEALCILLPKQAAKHSAILCVVNFVNERREKAGVEPAVITVERPRIVGPLLPEAKDGLKAARGEVPEDFAKKAPKSSNLQIAAFLKAKIDNKNAENQEYARLNLISSAVNYLTKWVKIAARRREEDRPSGYRDKGEAKTHMGDKLH